MGLRERKRGERLLGQAQQVIRRPKWDLRKICTDPKHGFHARQHGLITDPSLRKVVVCTRRAGKTTANAIMLVDTAQRVPNGDSVFLGLDRQHARKTIWRELTGMAKAFFPACEVHEGLQLVTMPNGHRIWVAGAPDMKSSQKWRGMATDLVIIDECQDIAHHLDDLIYLVIMPTLSDRDGTLVLTGTPARAKVGAFWEAWDPDAAIASPFRRFEWGFWDNPFYMKGRAKGERLDEQRRNARIPVDGSKDPAWFTREWLGQWRLDDMGRVFLFDPDRNGFTDADLPRLANGQPVPMEHVMGIDTGHNDADAIAVLGWDPKDPGKRLWLVDEYVRPRDVRQGWDELWAIVKSFHDRYRPMYVVIDPRDGAKASIDFAKRYGLSIEMADKGYTRGAKAQAIEALNADLLSGRLRVRADSRFAEESYAITWTTDEYSTRSPTGGLHSDIADALRYAWTKCYHHLSEAPGARRKEPDPWESDEAEDAWFNRQRARDGKWWEEARSRRHPLPGRDLFSGR